MILVPPPNDEQSIALAEPRGPKCLISAPGSGKTTFLSQLIDRLLRSGVSPRNICGVTFSKEMAVTAEKRTGNLGIFATFHSLGYKICSYAGRQAVEPERRERLLQALSRKWRFNFKELVRFIEDMKRSGITPLEAAEGKTYDYGLVNAYHEYEEERKDQGWIDFGSMVSEAVTLLENPEFRKSWQYEFCIVDEAQDTDSQQFRLLQLISEKHGNVTVVGDESQCIYGFRGAVPENLSKFQTWFPGGKFFYLGRNYRSTRQIVKFVRENAPAGTPQELLEKMIAARPDEGVPPTLKMYWSETDEAEGALAGANTSPLDSIILSRTNAWLGRLENLCDVHNIRYHLLGQTSFWKQNEVQKTITALRAFTHLPLPAAISTVISNVRRYYDVEDRTQRDNRAIENLMTLAEVSQRFVSVHEFTNYAQRKAHQRNIARGVTLGTIHCSPPDEPILTTQGFKKIANLDPKTDRIYSYAPKCNQLLRRPRHKPREAGYQFSVKTRQYEGQLVVIDTAKSHTRVTPEHRVRVSFHRCFYDKWVVYLMRRGNWWRIGTCTSDHRPYYSGGVRGRMASEKADGAWILGVYNTREEALFAEGEYQTMYGITGLCFERGSHRLSAEQLASFHNRFASIMLPRARHLLKQKGLLLDMPLYTREGGRRVLNLTWFDTAAANMINEYMVVPVATSRDFQKKSPSRPTPLLAKVRREQYVGPVFSLEVLPHHYYVSGGTIVHNSAKGGEWKNVFIVGARADLIPHAKAENKLEEERIWFVAISRPADLLRISWSGTPSPYLRRYLDPETLAALQEQASAVEKIQKQQSLF